MLVLVFCALLVVAASANATATPSAVPAASAPQEAPVLRLAIAGLNHGHVHGFMRSVIGDSEVELVGVFDDVDSLRAAAAERYGLDEKLFFSSLETMLDVVAPDVVATFTSTAAHLTVVEASAPRGIHVMVEKPLAVSLDHAARIASLADAHGILVLVNYETTWYGSTWTVGRDVLDSRAIGSIRKVVVHDGHQGPKEIGVGPEFLDWLVDPERNGAGALYDFGCYGANLATWLMDMRRPGSVTAVTQQLKEDPVYWSADDEATILLTYPDAQVIIQASWNWPFNRKDMDVYGSGGSMHALDARRIRSRIGSATETESIADDSLRPFSGPLDMLKSVITDGLPPDALSSLENNLIVSEILDAARESARLGRTITLNE